jgi:hypothetical protein
MSYFDFNTSQENNSPRLVMCPDCTASALDRLLTHDATCPAGNALEKVTDADRQWFEEHPAEDKRLRPLTAAEVTDYRMHGHTGQFSKSAMILVTEIEPGLRMRQVCTLAWVPGEGDAA